MKYESNVLFNIMKYQIHLISSSTLDTTPHDTLLHHLHTISAYPTQSHFSHKKHTTWGHHGDTPDKPSPAAPNFWETAKPLF